MKAAFCAGVYHVDLAGLVEMQRLLPNRSALARLNHNVHSDDGIPLTDRRAIARTLELDPVHPKALCGHSQLPWSAAKGFQNRPALRAVTAALKVDSRCEPALYWRGVVLFHDSYFEEFGLDPA